MSTTRLRGAARQALLAEAVVRVLARSGFEGATVRAVAAEAGVSPGAVQKQFPTRDGLLLAACRHVLGGYTTRAGLLPTDLDPGDAVRALLLEALPLDDARRQEALVWSAITDRAGRSSELAEVARAVDAHVHDELTALLGARRDPAGAATVLLAVCDGLAVRLTYDPGFATEAVRALDAALEAVRE